MLGETKSGTAGKLGASTGVKSDNGPTTPRKILYKKTGFGGGGLPTGKNGGGKDKENEQSNIPGAAFPHQTAVKRLASAS